VIYHLLNPRNKILLSNLPSELGSYFEECNSRNSLIERCYLDGKTKRIGKIISEHGIAFLIADEPDLVKSSRLFTEKLSIYSAFLKEANGLREGVLKDILHDLTAINARSIQELYTLVPQDLLAKQHADQLEEIKKQILTNPKQASLMFIKIAKNNLTMQAEFANLENLYSEHRSANLQSHCVEKVVWNTLHPFMQDFANKGIRVNVGSNKKKVQLDYRSFHGALVPLFDNATKYAMLGSWFFIKFIDSKEDFRVQLEMTSLQIKPEEREKIFERGYSGINAKKTRSYGSGLGLAMAVDLLSYSKAKLRLLSPEGSPMVNSPDHFDYEKNIFEILIPRDA